MPDFCDMYPPPKVGEVVDICLYCQDVVIFKGRGSVAVSANPVGKIAHWGCMIKHSSKNTWMWTASKPKPEPKSFTAPKGATHG